MVFDDLSTPRKKSYSESQLKRDSEQKNSLVMILLHPHHPTHSLSVIGNFLVRYLFMTSFSKGNPRPGYTGWIYQWVRAILIHCIGTYNRIALTYRYVQNNPTKVRFVLKIV